MCSSIRVASAIRIVLAAIGFLFLLSAQSHAQRTLTANLQADQAATITLGDIAASIEAVAGYKTAAQVCFDSPWGKICLQRKSPVQMNVANISKAAMDNSGIPLAQALYEILQDFDQFARRARIPGTEFVISRSYSISYPSVKQVGVKALIDIDIDININF